MKDMQHTISSLVPYGLVASRSWLMSKGVQRHTVDNWVKSGQLVAVGHGVFKLPATTKLTWEGVVCSLQRMGNAVIPGGLTALTLQGNAHYLSSSAPKTINLYGGDKWPKWADKLLPEITFVRHKDILLKKLNSTGLENNVYSTKENEYRNGTMALAWRLDEWPLTISDPERAMFEVLLDVPQHVSFEHANQLLQGLTTLSPTKVNRLLERCSNIKVKRLFLWLAEKNQSPWLKKIDLEKFSMASGFLGTGKRMIATGGKLDSKYLITVPQEMSGNMHG